MTDRFRERLSEYLDGELSAAERALVERHLAECEACAEAVRDLAAVVERARGLPGREPPEQVWEGIAARIAGSGGAGAEVSSDPVRGGIARRRIVFSIPQLAAAGVTLAALSAGIAWLAGSAAPSAMTAGPRPDAAGVGDARAVRTADIGMADYYAGAISALESALFDAERPLDPETEIRVRQALETIDRALADARRALEASPNDPYLREHVTDTMRRKSEFLRRAVKLAAQS